jgi:hypothetical protein
MAASPVPPCYQPITCEDHKIMANQTQTPKRETAIATAILTADGIGATGVAFMAPSLKDSVAILLPGCAPDDGWVMVGDARVNTVEINPNLLNMAACHGIKQKCIDAAAISRNPDTGKSATVADKWAALGRVVDRITSDDGTWNEAREGGGNQGGLLLRALMRLQPNKTKEQLVAWLEGKADKEQAALRANPKIAPIIAELKAEQDRKNADQEFDTDAALDELQDL